LILLIACGKAVPTPAISSIVVPTSTAPLTRSITFEQLLEVVKPLVSNISQSFTNYSSDLQAMTSFKDQLIALNLKAGLTQITSQLRSSGILDSCVTVQTSDLGLINLYVLPSDFSLTSEDERLQVVYLKANEKVGLIPA